MIGPTPPVPVGVEPPRIGARGGFPQKSYREPNAPAGRAAGLVALAASAVASACPAAGKAPWKQRVELRCGPAYACGDATGRLSGHRSRRLESAVWLAITIVIASQSNLGRPVPRRLCCAVTHWYSWSIRLPSASRHAPRTAGAVSSSRVPPFVPSRRAVTRPARRDLAGFEAPASRPGTGRTDLAPARPHRAGRRRTTASATLPARSWSCRPPRTLPPPCAGANPLPSSAAEEKCRCRPIPCRCRMPPQPPRPARRRSRPRANRTTGSCAGDRHTSSGHVRTVQWAAAIQCARCAPPPRGSRPTSGAGPRERTLRESRPYLPTGASRPDAGEPPDDQPSLPLPDQTAASRAALPRRVLPTDHGEAAVATFKRLPNLGLSPVCDVPTPLPVRKRHANSCRPPRLARLHRRNRPCTPRPRPSSPGPYAPGPPRPSPRPSVAPRRPTRHAQSGLAPFHPIRSQPRGKRG